MCRLQEQNTFLAKRLKLYYDSIQNLQELLAVQGIGIPEHAWISRPGCLAELASISTGIGSSQLPWCGKPSFQQFRQLRAQSQAPRTASCSPEMKPTTTNSQDTIRDSQSNGSSYTAFSQRSSLDEDSSVVSPWQLQIESPCTPIYDPFVREAEAICANHEKPNSALNFDSLLSEQCGPMIDATWNEIV